MARQPPAGPDLAQFLAGLLPPMLLEARISGRGPLLGDQLITQLGLSVQAAQNVDLAILARTSGAAFVVGIGSFVAYKLLCRLAQSDSLWATLDQMVVQHQLPTPSSPSRAVELTEGFYAVRLGGEHELLRRLDECLENEEGTSRPGSRGRIAVVQVRQGAGLRKLIGSSQRVQRAGIAVCSNEQEWPEGRPGSRSIVRRSDEERNRMRRRDEDEESVTSGVSDMTSASRIAPNAQNDDVIEPIELAPEGDEAVAASGSGSSTPVSAMFQCGGDGASELCWENEFSEHGGGDAGGGIMGEEEEPEGLFLFRERSGGSLGSLSQLSAMQNLERMFRSMPPLYDERRHDQTDGRAVESALDKLRNLDWLETQSNTGTSSLATSGGVAKRCWLSEGVEISTNSAKFPRDVYKIVDPKADFDLSERSMTPSSVDKDENSRPQHQKSQGLWELTTPTQVPSTSRLASFEKSKIVGHGSKPDDHLLLAPAGSNKNVMVDSAISCSRASSLASTSTHHQRSRRGTVPDTVDGSDGAMFDSAIVTDDYCSGSRSNVGHEMEASSNLNAKFGAISKRNAKSGVISRTFVDPSVDELLGRISEKSTPVRRAKTERRDSTQESEPSLEWF